ncbi:IclR family transcriptional regulator [Oleiharenicola sp. Vm1]|uniref:IclR family transcriptional regulator n=1 Tax=Oleiharenicola sp. Vm1 TaxID=3398393 RepID=UPI0039F6170C
MPKTPSYPVPALEKGLDILETLAAAAVPQSLAELATSLDRSSSELFRMLNCLEQRGYITREPVSGKYSLTLKLFSLAHAHSVTEKLLRAANVPMQELTEKVRESVHLSVLEGDRLLVVAQQESPERVRLSIEIGGQFDPVETASGRLLLAHVDDERREQACAGSPAWKALSARARAALLESLAEIRRTGLSFAESETIEGVRDVAVLVGNPASGVVAALAITRLLRRGQRGDEAALVAAMRGAAREITESLGWEGTK